MTTLGRALGQDLAEVEDDRSFGELDDGAHHVLDPQDGRSELVADVPHDLDRGGELRLVETRHHLVEQQHLGLARERLRQLEKPLLDGGSGSRPAGRPAPPARRTPTPRPPAASPLARRRRRRPTPNIAPRTTFSRTVIEPKGSGRCIAIAIPLRLSLMGGEAVDPRTVAAGRCRASAAPARR